MDNNEQRIPSDNIKSAQQREYRSLPSRGYIKQKWFALGCLTAILLLIISSIMVFSGLMLLGRQKKDLVRSDSYLNLQMSGMIEEYREIDQDFFYFSRTDTARQLIDRINNAADDDRIAGIILEPSLVISGYATLNEIIVALERFKSRGKPIYAYLETASNSDYYLASIADKIYLHPSASSGILLNGVGISSLYMRDLLDKLGIKMTVLHAGDYKSAGENFTRMEMSPEFRESATVLVDDIYENLLNNLTRQRGWELTQVKEIIEEREDLFIKGDYALESGAVDQLASREAMLEELGIGSDQLLSSGRYSKKTSLSGERTRIAVVYLQGMIMLPTGGFNQNFISSQKVERIFEKIEKDRRIMAVVIRVDSPGGSALESEKIYQQIERLNLTKPIVISMGNTAASGGYYIAAAGDHIVADPFTITGSIGVAAMIPNLEQMGKKIGVRPQTISRGKYSNLLNPWEEPEPADIAALQNGLDDTYIEFKERVSKGRSIPFNEVESIARGRIWSSQKALEHNLIDEIGNLDRAIRKAAELAMIVDYQTIYLPETKTLFEMLLERRFDFRVVNDIIFSSVYFDEKIRTAERLLQAVKKEPLQMLSPVDSAE